MGAGKKCCGGMSSYTCHYMPILVENAYASTLRSLQDECNKKVVGTNAVVYNAHNYWNLLWMPVRCVVYSIFLQRVTIVLYFEGRENWGIQARRVVGPELKSMYACMWLLRCKDQDGAITCIFREKKVLMRLFC